MPYRRYGNTAYRGLNRRDTIYYGVLGNVTEEQVEIVNNLMEPILTQGFQSVVMSVLFGEQTIVASGILPDSCLVALLSLAFFTTVRYLLYVRHVYFVCRSTVLISLSDRMACAVDLIDGCWPH